MASPGAHCLTCEVVHASVAGGNWHSCMEPVCQTLPPLLVWALPSMSFWSSQNATLKVVLSVYCVGEFHNPTPQCVALT